MISAETTILTEPITADGQYVDYFTWARLRFETLDATFGRKDQWCLLGGLLKRSPELRQDLPFFLEFEHAFKEWVRDHPKFEQDWGGISGLDVGVNQVHMFQLQEDSHPAIAEFLKVNEPWYAAVMSSEPTPARFECSRNETVPYLAGCLLHRSQEYRILAGRFAIRAALRFHGGDFEAGLRDAQIIIKAAEHCETYCLIGLRMSWIIRQQAYEEIMQGLLLCRTVNDSAYQALLRLPIDFLDKDVEDLLDGPQRFVLLDLIQKLHREPMAHMGVELSLPQSLWPVARRFAAHEVNFEKLMRLQNHLVDQILVAMRKPDFREQARAMEIAFLQHQTIVESPPFSVSFFGHDFQAYAEQQISKNSDMKTLPESIAEQKNIRRVLHLAVRLSLWKSNAGSYPDTLSDVLTIPNLPPVSERVLIDAFTDQPFAFERVGELYRIRSAGPDMILDREKHDDISWPDEALVQSAE